VKNIPLPAASHNVRGVADSAADRKNSTSPTAAAPKAGTSRGAAGRMDHSKTDSDLEKDTIVVFARRIRFAMTARRPRRYTCPPAENVGGVNLWARARRGTGKVTGTITHVTPTTTRSVSLDGK